jgi:hypothetical protein
MQPSPPPPPVPAIAPWFPPPTYPPPRSPQKGGSDSRALASLLAAILGIVFGLAAGVPGLVLGPIAYFLGKSAVGRIDASQGVLGGRGTAAAGWVMGVVATAIGAIVSLFWIVVLLEAFASAPSS